MPNQGRTQYFSVASYISGRRREVATELKIVQLIFVIRKSSSFTIHPENQPFHPCLQHCDIRYSTIPTFIARVPMKKFKTEIILSSHIRDCPFFPHPPTNSPIPSTYIPKVATKRFIGLLETTLKRVGRIKGRQ